MSATTRSSPLPSTLSPSAVAATREAISPAAGAAHAVGDGEQRRLADPGVLVAPALPARDWRGRCCVRRSIMPRTSGRSRRRERGRRPRSLRALESRTPLTKVPFVEPTSSIQTPSRRGSTRACCAEAKSSPSRLTSFGPPRPIEMPLGVEHELGVLVDRGALEDDEAAHVQLGLGRRPTAAASRGPSTKLSCGRRRSRLAVRTIRQMKR